MMMKTIVFVKNRQHPVVVKVAVIVATTTTEVARDVNISPDIKPSSKIVKPPQLAIRTMELAAGVISSRLLLLCCLPVFLHNH
jgi:hypothetical protein